MLTNKSDTATTTAKKTTGWTYLRRWVSGHCLDGKKRTNATFLYKASRTPPGQHRVCRWAHYPGWKRSAIRNGALIAVAFIAWAWMFHGDVMPTYTRYTFWVLTTLFVVYWVHKLRRRSHKRDFETGLEHWYSAFFDVPLHDVPQYIDIPMGHRKHAQSAVTIKFPPYFAATQAEQERLAEKIGHKLGLHDPEWNFTMIGRPTLTISLVPTPPKVVSLMDRIRDAN